MQIFGPFRVQASQPIPGSDRMGGARPAPTPAAEQRPGSVDQLDLSPEAQAMGRMAPTSSAEGEMRLDRIAAVRRAIADGSYETPEKLDRALDRLLDDLA